MKLLSFLLFLVMSFFSMAQSVNILNSAVWLESAYVEWSPVDNVGRYNVYYSEDGVEQKLIDGTLVSDYGEYFRTDIIGLKAGTYTIYFV